ncbi:MAG: hypothetical protein UX39_C0012G0016 [Candidatus Magasanikbacteria bacterium GW2011_GWA2_46_17]|uniref:Uncharacterized protein n=1 Tax=Candidatus Magasanikbacteria bacterium GW2011_GWA2_46_17 TaxID=1619042 RepID=A0A0G1NZR8_9BACT|nr:MAG: hypothetical protein UX39_C0012G0016 [Candidatus Magasanikbacteria bacterium GW2011_GWA2_46_17]
MKSKNFLIIIVVAVLLLLAGTGYFIMQKKQAAVSDYHAVFLTNGQVYFGKITEERERYIKLTDIYYLQLKQPLQNQGAVEQLNPSDISLIKLGNELHGPTDAMNINRDQVLFTEQLREQSKVMSAIRGDR